MQDFIGRTLGHYGIVEMIGKGGMGVVYRGRDERLDRDVAIKVLPEEVAADPDRLRRFEREAKALAKLTHPNILQIFEFGEDRGMTFAVTELLDGETLRQRLEGGPLPWRRAVDVGAAVADGLAAAHGEGIVHRDLKPDNVFLTEDGRIKVLDFGLAKIEEGPVEELETVTSPSSGTVAGTMLGTIGYMAPEQVRGEPADLRSDVFALGCVVHEMLTGASPFRRDTTAEAMAAILRDDPPAVSIPEVEQTSEISRILARCLEKHPTQRFQSAADLAFGLRSVKASCSGVELTEAGSSAGSRGELCTIVVLPFANLSPDPDNEYFSDGITEEIIADLAKVKGLRVISRTSSMRFKNADRDLKSIATELGVQFVLEGSVRRAGESLRITAQLIDASTDSHLWAEKYSGTIDDVFDLQEELSRRIVSGLEVTLTAEEDRRLATRPIRDPAVFDAWLRARQAGLTMTRSGVALGTDLIEHAGARSEDNPLLLAAGAWLKVLAYTYVPDTPDEAFEEAEATARRALELQPDHPWGLYAMAAVCHRRGDIQGFVRYATRSVEIEENSHVLAALGSYLADAGRPDLGRGYANRSLAIDPLSWLSHWAAAYIDLVEGRCGEIIDEMKAAAERLAPGETWSSFSVGHAAVHIDNEALATEYFQIAARGGDELYSELSRLFLTALSGDHGRTRDLVRGTALERLAKRTGHTSIMIASCLTRVGETDEALRWMDHAVNQGFLNDRYLLEVNPLLKPFREHPRFLEITDRARRLGRELEV
jgi:serine/threonine protein kinase/tetratricopeptide (TPR) repeat protein